MEGRKETSKDREDRSFLGKGGRKALERALIKKGLKRRLKRKKYLRERELRGGNSREKAQDRELKRESSKERKQVIELRRESSKERELKREN